MPAANRLSERWDLNPRPPEPHSGALPGCATLRARPRYTKGNGQSSFVLCAGESSLPPPPNCLGVPGIVTVCIEPEPAAKPRISFEVLLRNTLQIPNEPAMSLISLTQYLRKRKMLLLTRFQRIESIDPAVHDGISCRPPTLSNDRQVREGLFLPPRYVRDDVLHRPVTGNPDRHHLRIRKPCIRFQKCLPRTIQTREKLRSIHSSLLRLKR